MPTLKFGGDVQSSTDALALTEVPQSLAVVGAGYIGMELGMAFAKLGAKVTIVEALAKILPLYDAELTQPVVRRLAELGVEALVGARALGFANGALKVAGADGEEREIVADKVLVAVGRRARSGGLGLETLDLTMSGPFVRIDATCATSMRNVWAIGDVTGEPMLAHRAMAQGEMVAEIIAGRKRAFDRVAIPAICFTDPEIVAVGLSPEAAKATHGEITVGHFPFRANGRAMTLQDDEGFVRVVARADNHVVLGIHAVGAGVSELSAAFSLGLEMGARLEDIALTIHAHPTLSEAFHELRSRRWATGCIFDGASLVDTRPPGAKHRAPQGNRQMASQPIFCMGCWQNMKLPIALRTIAAVPYRAVGIRQSRMNPNVCTICETMFERVMKARQVELDATILFADLRGYTSLSQSQSSGAIARLLDAFYDVCGEAIWEHDGIINKTMGDAVLAIFNFPIKREDHAAHAFAAARMIQELWRARREQLSQAFGAEAATIGVGIGLDTGKVNFGEFGRTHHDLTAIGTVVNVASRAQSAAAADQILMTAAVREKVAAALPESAGRDYQLKGIDAPAKLWAA